jgi:hypothetical protein
MPSLAIEIMLLSFEVFSEWEVWNLITCNCVTVGFNILKAENASC